MRMERNLNIKNKPFRPTRSCLKMIGPGEVILIKMAQMIKIGEKIMIKKRAEKTSIPLLIGSNSFTRRLYKGSDFLVIFASEKMFKFKIIDYFSDKIANMKAAVTGDIANKKGIWSVNNC